MPTAALTRTPAPFVTLRLHPVPFTPTSYYVMFQLSSGTLTAPADISTEFDDGYRVSIVKWGLEPRLSIWLPTPLSRLGLPRGLLTFASHW